MAEGRPRYTPFRGSIVAVARGIDVDRAVELPPVEAERGPHRPSRGAGRRTQPDLSGERRIVGHTSCNHIDDTADIAGPIERRAGTGEDLDPLDRGRIDRGDTFINPEGAGLVEKVALHA